MLLGGSIWQPGLKVLSDWPLYGSCSRPGDGLELRVRKVTGVFPDFLGSIWTGRQGSNDGFDRIGLDHGMIGDPKSADLVKTLRHVIVSHEVKRFVSPFELFFSAEQGSKIPAD